MSRYKFAGYYDTTATDGRALRIVFPHDDRLREEEDIVETVMVLREFAADCTAGKPDVNGKLPHPGGRPCDVILASHPGLHPSKSDPNPHLSIQIASHANWNQNPRITWSGYHVYSQNNDIKQGYGAWFRTKNASTAKITSAKIVADVEAALQNDMRRPPTPPKQPSPPSQPSPPKEPSPPPSGAVGFMADGKTPVYWSKSQRKYYWQGPDQVKHGCAGPGSQFPSASRSSTAQASSSASTSSSSKHHQASASKPSSSSASSSNNPPPAGYTPNGIPYYYSATQKQYYYIGPNGKKLRYNP